MQMAQLGKNGESYSLDVATESAPYSLKKRDRSCEMEIETPFGFGPARTSHALGVKSRPVSTSFGETTGMLIQQPGQPVTAQSLPTGKIRKTMAMDCEELTPHSLLPCTEKCSDALKRITPETLADVLEGKYMAQFQDFLIIDCRYPYEFTGGHIQGALNINTTGALESTFFPLPGQRPRVVVFHCEFSVQRAPMMGLHLRNHDRNANMSLYPHLDYPNVYILDGGYASFFSKFQHHCSPNGYTTMNDPAHSDELRKFSQMHKKEFKRCYSTGFLRT
ncbi:Rhodanese-like domain-containing protein [Obelidium mucronatum]|nr:Rhodanese-like domain-containing protein [Obelidium mucronatum]